MNPFFLLSEVFRRYVEWTRWNNRKQLIHLRSSTSSINDDTTLFWGPDIFHGQWQDFANMLAPWKHCNALFFSFHLNQLVQDVVHPISLKGSNHVLRVLHVRESRTDDFLFNYIELLVHFRRQQVCCLHLQNCGHSKRWIVPHLVFYQWTKETEKSTHLHDECC